MRGCLYVLCGHLLGKGWPFGSRLWCLTVSLWVSHWYPWTGVVLDCIDSWSLHHYLLTSINSTCCMSCKFGEKFEYDNWNHIFCEKYILHIRYIIIKEWWDKSVLVVQSVVRQISNPASVVWDRELGPMSDYYPLSFIQVGLPYALVELPDALTSRRDMQTSNFLKWCLGNKNNNKSSLKLIMHSAHTTLQECILWFYSSNFVWFWSFITKSILIASCRTWIMMDYFRDVCVCVHCCIWTGLIDE